MSVDHFAYEMLLAHRDVKAGTVVRKEYKRKPARLTCLGRDSLRLKPGLSILRFLENLVFVITSGILRILMEHIEIKNSLDYNPSVYVPLEFSTF